jgi:transposase
MKTTYDNAVCGGMDVHYKFSQVTFCDSAGGIVGREQLEHPDRVLLRERIGRWPPGITMALEASFGWGWLSDLMAEEGVDVRLSNCYKVEQMRKARGQVKTNQKDADLLSLLPLEKTGWWEVWRAPQEVRSRREQMRFRGDLVALQTAVKNRIHAMFHRHGIFHAFSDLFGGKGRLWLSELAQRGCPELPSQALQALRGHLGLLDHVRQQMASVERVLQRQLETTPQVRRLVTIPGVGRILSHVLTAEIGQIERFRNHKALASYSLLAPRAQDTGQPDPTQTPKGRHLGTRGNTTLKWAFIEAAHGAVRHGGRWRAMFDRVTQSGKKDRNRGYIKVARELVKIVYAVWKTQADYRQSGPAGDPSAPVRRAGGAAHSRTRPDPPALPRNTGSGTRSRSGTGQPFHPMVPALGQ